MTEISTNNGSIPLLNFQPKPKHEDQRQCFMCCENNDENLIPTSEGISRRFCVLISRFLDFKIENFNYKNYQTLNKYQDQDKFETEEEKGLLVCCRKCVPVIESFCVDYDQFFKLRLELSCDLRRISQLLKSTIKNNNKNENLHQEEEQNGLFQSQLLRQCENFFDTRDFPFLNLRRSHPPPLRNDYETVAVATTPLIINPLDSDDEAEPDLIDEGDTTPLIYLEDSNDDEEPEIIHIDTDVHDDYVVNTAEAAIRTVNEDTQTQGFPNQPQPERIISFPNNDIINEMLHLSRTVIHKSPTNHPFECGTCGKLCGDKHKLKKHEKSHLNIRPYACRFCGNRFKMRGHCITHERIHTGEKPFKCPVTQCGFRFRQKSDCKKHMIKLHQMNDGVDIIDDDDDGQSKETQNQTEADRRPSRSRKVRQVPRVDDDEIIPAQEYFESNINLHGAMAMELEINEITPTTLVQPKPESPKNCGEAGEIGPANIKTEFILPDLT